MRSLPEFVEFERKPKQDLRALFSAASPDAIDLLQKLLTYDPRKRITAKQVRERACVRACAWKRGEKGEQEQKDSYTRALLSAVQPLAFARACARGGGNSCSLASPRLA